MRAIPWVLGSALLGIALGSAPAVASPGCSTLTPALGELVTCTSPTSSALVTIPAGALSMTVNVLGAGGGGGGSRGSGIAGAGANGAGVGAVMEVYGFSTVEVRVGVGGTGGDGGTSAPTAGTDGSASRLVGGGEVLVLASGGGGGEGADSCLNGAAGAAASGSMTFSGLTRTANISVAGGGIGGAGGSAANGAAGQDGTVTFTFNGISPDLPANTPGLTRSVVWRDVGGVEVRVPGFKEPVGGYRDGTWQETPKHYEWPGSLSILLGWATHPDFPVSLARSATSAFDGPVNGQRMIFIPAGQPTFLSGDTTLHAIRTEPVVKGLIARC